jgi:hypothetical protein
VILLRVVKILPALQIATRVMLMIVMTAPAAAERKAEINRKKGNLRSKVDLDLNRETYTRSQG